MNEFIQLKISIVNMFTFVFDNLREFRKSIFTEGSKRFLFDLFKNLPICLFHCRLVNPHNSSFKRSSTF